MADGLSLVPRDTAGICHKRFIEDWFIEYGLGNIVPGEAVFPAVIPFLVNSLPGASFAILSGIPLDILSGK
jgi:hypothetical protein